MLSSMRRPSVYDVADAIRERIRGAGAVKVHKLLYFAQGIYLAWAGEPMFDEPIEAWANGPVVADLWYFEKHGGDRPAPLDLDSGQLSVVERVIEIYGGMTAAQLIHLTHSDGGPWCQITETDDPFLPGNARITHELMESWFAVDRRVVAERTAVEKLKGKVPSLSPDHGGVSPGAVDALRQALAGDVVWDPRPA